MEHDARLVGCARMGELLPLLRDRRSIRAYDEAHVLAFGARFGEPLQL